MNQFSESFWSSHLYSLSIFRLCKLLFIIKRWHLSKKNICFNWSHSKAWRVSELNLKARNIHLRKIWHAIIVYLNTLCAPRRETKITFSEGYLILCLSSLCSDSTFCYFFIVSFPFVWHHNSHYLFSLEQDHAGQTMRQLQLPLCWSKSGHDKGDDEATRSGHLHTTAMEIKREAVKTNQGECVSSARRWFYKANWDTAKKRAVLLDKLTR